MQRIAAVEWRGCAAREFMTSDPKNPAQKLRSVSIVHRVEDKERQLEIVEKVEGPRLEKFDVKKFNDGPKPFEKGQIVIWHISGYGWKGDGVKTPLRLAAAGTLEAIE